MEQDLKSLLETVAGIEMTSWQAEYEVQVAQLSMVRVSCYVFLGVLGAICIMNMINMMIHSVHIRKKELGILQAVGMSDASQDI